MTRSPNAYSPAPKNQPIRSPPAANSRRIAVKAADKAAFAMLCAGWEPVIVEAERSRYEQGSANDDGHP